jgi:hypothetical protein
MASLLESLFHTGAWYSNGLIALCWIYLIIMIPYILAKVYKGE